MSIQYCKEPWISIRCEKENYGRIQVESNWIELQGEGGFTIERSFGTRQSKLFQNTQMQLEMME